MSHSNSSLNCFANCMKKYEHNYILHTNPDKPDSPHLTFGTMAHEVLYKAGVLRDDNRDGVVNPDDYYSVIPSELLYDDLKNYFKINSWEAYFKPIIVKTAEIENNLLQEFKEKNKSVEIYREVKMSMTPNEVFTYTGKHILQSVVGIIDLLFIAGDEAVILDYKFSTNKKTQADFDMNSQLPLYAFFVHYKYNIPLRNIRVGYIDIPKQMFDKPTLLSNGTLSRSKSQNVLQDLYKKSVEAIHGKDDYYNCNEGGYYYECYCNLALNQVAYLSLQYLDEDTYNGILNDILDAAVTIDIMIKNKMPFCKKYDSYSCGNCEYLKSCKPWLGVNNE